ncbi:sucrose-specific PTS transporter subunit IIBC [Aerococcus viridans]|uniref:sucrose-specific PTS transporter subunit IIBC n=1 Tax=Aerococcus viridans TaxID=1377 RepID=UPI0028FDBE71|nr:sucrose-specific PTS transporter subunit IIBC [Aerococcus viridans]
MNHKEVAKRIHAALGEDNVVTAAHCATRLRLVVNDEGKIDQDALDNDPDLKGTFKANGQYQIIVGPGDVNKVYEEYTKIADIKPASKEEVKEAAKNQGKQNPVMAVIKVLSDIFVPLIPALTAGGLIMAVNNVLTSQNLFGPEALVTMYPAWADFADMINMFASAAFAFLPVLIAFSATKRFGGNPYLGATMGLIMVMPQLVNGYNVANVTAAGEMPVWNIFGLEIAQAGYQGQVLPVIGVAWILAKLETFFHKYLKDAIDFTFTPMLTIILTGVITFTVVGPVLRTLSDLLLNGIVEAISYLGAFGYGFFGLFYSAIVLTGLHQSFPAIETALIADVATTGGNFIFPIASVANVAQGAAALAVYFITKNEKTKGLATSSSLSAMLGITEPAMFGVNLKLKYPFFIGLIASGIASVILGIFNVRSQSLGPAGVIGFVAIIPRFIPTFMLAIAVSIVIAFVATYIYGKSLVKKEANDAQAEIEKEAKVVATHETEETTNTSKTNTSVATNTDHASDDNTIVAPLAGKITDLENVNDPVFSQGMMGPGLAIVPDASGNVYAPISGSLTIASETGHAYGLVSDSGLEVLIHIGIDTVNLNGHGFTSEVKQGDQVNKGALLGSFDLAVIKESGYDPDVMVIVTNADQYENVEVVADGQVAEKTAIIKVK